MEISSFFKNFNGNHNRNSSSSNSICEHLVNRPDDRKHGFANSVSLFLQRLRSGSKPQNSLFSEENNFDLVFADVLDVGLSLFLEICR